MARPTSPVIPGLEQLEIIYGENQEGVEPLPALRGPDPTYTVYSRWVLTDEERESIAKGADILIHQWTFGKPYQPTLVSIANANDNAQIADKIAEQLGFDRELDERLQNMLDSAFKS